MQRRRPIRSAAIKLYRRPWRLSPGNLRQEVTRSAFRNRREIFSERLPSIASRARAHFEKSSGRKRRRSSFIYYSKRIFLHGDEKKSMSRFFREFARWRKKKRFSTCSASFLSSPPFPALSCLIFYPRPSFSLSFHLFAISFPLFPSLSELPLSLSHPFERRRERPALITIWCMAQWCH